MTPPPLDHITQACREAATGDALREAEFEAEAIHDKLMSLSHNSKDENQQYDCAYGAGVAKDIQTMIGRITPAAIALSAELRELEVREAEWRYVNAPKKSAHSQAAMPRRGMGTPNEI